MKYFKIFSEISATVALSITIMFGLVISTAALAAQPTVDLKTATPFAILAGTAGITNVGPSNITGNVGLSPATGAGITGLTCPEVTGTIYSVNAAGPQPCLVTNGPLLVTAKNDLTAAFLDAQGRTPFTTVSNELGGTTKTAGVYLDNSPLQITAGAGPLVLDGQGDPSSVFIFQSGVEGTGLIVGPGSSVSLVNGANACNIFWKVDTATIDTTAVFKGSILALNSITVKNGANIEGRLLAQDGNVTLDSDTITGSVCGASTTTTTATTPKFPNTGVASSQNGNTTSLAILGGIVSALALLAVARRKHVI